MWASLLALAGVVALATGHGRVLNPPGRGTAWRLGYNARANYDDDGLNCGGFHRQHSENGGLCGLCGDPYDASQPRAHERGGIYDSGVIVGTYEEGQVITVTVEITAYHLGYWEFKLCPEETNQECFDENPVELEDGGTRYYPKKGATEYHVNYKLPEGVTCESCVLQWRYTAGNNWGQCNNGTQGLGCGNQETFGACSDIAILPNSDTPQYVDADSLLLKDVDLGLVRLLLNSAMMPQQWINANSIQAHSNRAIQNSIQPPTKNKQTYTNAKQRLKKSSAMTSKRNGSIKRKHRRKKKTRPRKKKWP